MKIASRTIVVLYAAERFDDSRTVTTEPGRLQMSPPLALLPICLR